MSEDSLGMKLMNQITELGNLELVDSQLSVGIFLKIIEETVKGKLDSIDKDLNLKIKLYNIKAKNAEGKKQNILQKYEEEFCKISEEFEKRFINIQIELNDAESNQKIALANLKKVADEKKEVLNSKQYKEYITKKNKLEKNLENAKKDEDYEKYSKLLTELNNPLDLYNRKINACATKYNEYNTIIDECMIETTICKDELVQALDSVMKYTKQDLSIAKRTNRITGFINKLACRFSGKSKFEEKVINKMEQDLEKLSFENDKLVEVIEENSGKFLATIELMKRKITKEFKLSIS